MQIARRASERCLPNAPNDAALAIILASRGLIRSLNEEFLHHSGDTDVIAFEYAASGGPADFAADDELLWGEIYVCLPVAERAAQEHRTSVSFEVILYIIHGLLHLAGFDDHTDSDRRRMRRREMQIMSVVEAEFGAADVFQQ